MGSSTTNYVQLLLVLLIAFTLVAGSLANRDRQWQYGFNYTDWAIKYGYYHPNQTQGPTKITVGGSSNWQFGVNYTDWTLKNGPVYLNDVLVFKYDPPNNGTHGHSVYMLPNWWSFITCDFRWAKKVADVNQGGGNGFEFKLKRWRPYYFACGESNGFHCNVGQMKFFVMPMFRGWPY